MRIIYHHLGLGDHIVCNALVRALAGTSECGLFAKYHNFTSVSAMFQDIPSLSVVGVKDDREAKEIAQYSGNTTTYVGMFCKNWGDTIRDHTADEAFYVQMGVPFERRWSGFMLLRDHKREKRVAEMYEVNSRTPFALVHDDDRYRIDDRRLPCPRSMKIVRMRRDFTNNLMDYCWMLENAAEVHCIESCVMFLADSLKPVGKLHAHRYARPLEPLEIPHTKLDWKVLT